MNDLDAILIVKWEVPNCIVLHKCDGKIARNEFLTKQEAIEFCKFNGIAVKEIIGKGWKEGLNGSLSGV